MLVAVFFAAITSNTIANLQKAGLTSGFGFLGDQAFFDINQRLIDYTSQSSFGRALIVGLLNTVLVSSLGIITATIIGFFAGILRLSNNWLVSRLITAYVEITRNVPLLLQIILWWAILTSLPKVRDSISFFGSFFLNNRGLRAPSPNFENPFFWVGITLVICLIVTVAIQFGAAKNSPERHFRLRFWRFSAHHYPLFVYYSLGQPINWDIPARTRFNFRGVHTTELPHSGLPCHYTGAFISEIVRAGVLVSTGQSGFPGTGKSYDALDSHTSGTSCDYPSIDEPIFKSHEKFFWRSLLAIRISSLLAAQSLTKGTRARGRRNLDGGISASASNSVFMNWYNNRISLVER